MTSLQNLNFEKVNAIYQKYFSLSYLGKDVTDKFACIALTCNITSALRKKGKKVTCYDVLLQIGKDYPDFTKNTFLKSLGAICDDFMYGCDTFPDFGISSKEMPKTVKKILDNYCPF